MEFSNEYIDVSGLVPNLTVQLKIEGANKTGSIKYKTALNLIESAERDGRLKRGMQVIESSSGNLGVALSSLCASKGYSFICVVDPNTPIQSVSTMMATGANVVTITKKDGNDGYLGSRLEFIKQYLQENENVFWTNQYSNLANPGAHKKYTATELLKKYERIDVLAIGAGTTGTLMGCLEAFSEQSPETKILAVDSVGSITFGDKPSVRYVPGLGTSRVPEIFNKNLVYDNILVPELDAIKMCRWLARTHGYLAGGSTGTVLAGLVGSNVTLDSSMTVVAISPDGGEKYVETVYNDEWVLEKFGYNFKNHPVLNDFSQLLERGSDEYNYA